MTEHVAHALRGLFALQLGKHRQDAEEGASHRGCGLDRLGGGDEANPDVVEALQRVVEVTHRPREPADAVAGDQRHVALAQARQHPLEVGPLGALARKVEVLKGLHRQACQRWQRFAAVELCRRANLMGVLVVLRDADVDKGGASGAIAC
ncbi:MAG TPA: hypothetical protein VHK65_04505 [Candidatus Dormibacteraeota bacterium]|nr:hypothetical protein [Candidatus Dormibacteraeota bacterium]